MSKSKLVSRIEEIRAKLRSKYSGRWIALNDDFEVIAFASGLPELYNKLAGLPPERLRRVVNYYIDEGLGVI